MHVSERPAFPEYEPAPVDPYTEADRGAQGPRRLSRRARTAAGVLVVAIVVTLGVRSGIAGYRSAREAAYPSAWDERVVGLAAFVEQKRGLDFDHPVAVDFLTVAEYRKQAPGDPADAVAGDEADTDLEHQAAVLRALGLASGPLDLGRASDDLSSDGTLAYYDDQTERITVRGTSMTVGMRVTLVHELTHALQDQHFDLGRDFGSDGANGAFQALVEGDAVRIEDVYIDQLSEDDAGAYWAEAGQQSDEADADLSGVPAAFQALFDAPYALGEPYASLLVGSGGQKALDRAFRTPPSSELALLDPAAGLGGKKPRSVARPKLGPGEKKTDATDLGALMLHTMLASRIDPAQALAAVDGWNGDALVSFDRAGTSCVRFAVAGADQAAADRLHRALDAWAATLEPGRPAVTANGAIVSVLACDPGPSAQRGPDPARIEQALTLPATRSQVMAEFSGLGFDDTESRCIGQGVISAFTPEELADPDGDFAETDAFDRTMDRIVDRCTSEPEDQLLTGHSLDT